MQLIKFDINQFIETSSPKQNSIILTVIFKPNKKKVQNKIGRFQEPN